MSDSDIVAVNPLKGCKQTFSNSLLGKGFMNNATILSKSQQELQNWYEKEKANGLKDIKFFAGDVSQATVDSFSKECLEIDCAIADKKYSPFPESF